MNSLIIAIGVSFLFALILVPMSLIEMNKIESNGCKNEDYFPYLIYGYGVFFGILSGMAGVFGLILLVLECLFGK